MLNDGLAVGLDNVGAHHRYKVVTADVAYKGILVIDLIPGIEHHSGAERDDLVTTHESIVVIE